MITYDGLKKKKCDVTEGMLTIGTGQFPIKTIKEVEGFKKKQMRLCLFLGICGLILAVPLILSIRDDIFRDPNNFMKCWTIFALGMGLVAYVFAFWIVARDLKYAGKWILNGTKSLLIEVTDDSAAVDALRGLQYRLPDSLDGPGVQGPSKIKWSYYVIVLFAMGVSGAMFLLGKPYGGFLSIGFVALFFVMRGRDLFMEMKETYWRR